MQISNQLNSVLQEYVQKTSLGDTSFSDMLEENLSKFDELEDKMKSITEQAKKDSDMFKVFDFMQIMNQLIYGNVSDKERSKLLAKAKEISQSV
ncbi:hypothetical protein CIG2463D_1754 [Campylobacter iguaniorum]|uniref:Uncharacterized protein n=1 Tax=Campylobacter iguaniorum TaxID=1244531 RepID=A0A076FAX7_9BACT|nr:hypothetical protein [Campylobacter iguaniorum]AII15380.1 hypothetical protein CIG1485E_1557 [Campylobacter iguaniorum]ALV25310.1 hypothetical protein CIG2463D_1754 [Campylobacter iguaniorum]